MKLWLISQDVNDSYDTYDSAVVAAETELAARQTHPSPFGCAGWGPLDDGRSAWRGRYDCEASNPAKHGQMYDYGSDDWAEPGVVKAVLIGEASPGIEPGVICGSFNAG